MRKILAAILVFALTFALVACGESTPPVSDTESAGSISETETDTVSTSAPTSETDTETEETSSSESEKTDSETASDTTSEEKEEWEPLKVMDNKVLVSDYAAKRIIVYDLDLVGEDGNLDDAEVWSLDNAYSASVKYREDTVFGDVILHTADYNASIVDYETKEVIWSAPGVAGWGVHSIEILPSGNVVTAANTDGILRMFNSANGVKNGDKVQYVDYKEVPGAHGVLWDPEYECLWALGAYDLIAYKVIDNGDGTESLQKIGGMGGKLPDGAHGGHDLAADLLDSRYLWITSTKVLRFDKEEGTFSTRYEGNTKLNKNGVKGFGNNLNENYIYTQSKHDDSAWLSAGNEGYTTDTIVFGYWKSENFLYLKKCVSDGAQFYKARVFYGKYQ
ncbi:MAG: hypothetical protein J6M34_02885 [Clostridia bacterium]|nr:hypothetical protein [Clostridia bacterium]